MTDYKDDIDELSLLLNKVTGMAKNQESLYVLGFLTIKLTRVVLKLLREVERSRV